MKKFIKAKTIYAGSPATDGIRAELDRTRHPGWPYCPPDEGDLLYQLAAAAPIKTALEVGFATGSTAAYMLTGLGSGNLTSIDYDQDHFERAGEALLARMDLSGRHTLIEADSVVALPALDKAGQRFGLIYLDGWKTFDRIWVDTFYSARMLVRDGYIVFDDARMPAVRKCMALLTRYYGFRRLDTYAYAGGRGQKIWHLLSTRSTLPPYAALQKTTEIGQSVAGKQYDFWAPF